MSNEQPWIRGKNADSVMLDVFLPEMSISTCVYDTDGDGNCQHCSNRVGCKNMGGQFEHKSKYPPGSPEHASADWQPN